MAGPGEDEDQDWDPEAEVEVPISDELDLHTFRPNEIGELVPEYLAECRKLGILKVRVVHGKGTGTLRESVHAICRKLDYVEDFALAGGGSGGWGATWVYLKRGEPAGDQE